MIRRLLLASLVCVTLLTLPAVSAIVAPPIVAPPIVAPASAAQTTAPATPASAITVSAETATANFPDGITFDLTADSPVPIVAAEVFFAPTAAETVTLGTAEFEPGTAVTASYTADFRGGQMPPGVDIAYYWRLTDADGAIMETPEQLVLWSDSRFQWEALPGENVTVYAYNGNPDFNAAILNAAERTIAGLSATYDAEMNEPIRIWAYNSGQDFAGALAPNSEPWIAGAAYPTLGLIISVLPAGDLGEVGRIVPHEVSHQVLYQATRNPWNTPPVWLDEGLAVIAQLNGSENFPNLVQAAADAGDLESIRVLNSQFPYDAEGALLGYAQSESIVNFIQATYGDEGIARLIAIFRDGVSYDEAVQGALGVSLDELDALWRESLGIADNGGAGTGLVGSDDQGIGGALEQLLVMGDAIVYGGMGLLAVVVGVVTLVRARRRRALAEDEPGAPDGAEPNSGPWSTPVSRLIG